MRSHPVQSGETFDGPPTLERSGSERRGGAVSSLFPEGERVGVRGGALFNGKEGRGDFRKNLLPLRIFVQITLINHVFYDVCAQTGCINVQTFAQINRTFLKYFLVYYRNSS